MFPVAPPVEGRTWLSTPPLPWSDLRGQVVVVVFWSFGCEASLLALRRLAGLTDHQTEPRTGVLPGSGTDPWPDEVTVLAVHTPRFPFEDDEAKVRAALARHRISLPVIHDPDYITWNRYSPGGWPATAVIGRTGRVVGIGAGASATDVIAEAVAVELAKPYRAGRRIDDRGDRTPGTRRRAQTGSRTADPAPQPKTSDDSTLSFPGGLAATDSGQLVVADSGNDRLLIGELDGDLRTLRPEVEITDIDNPIAVAWASQSVIYAIEGGTGSVLQVDLEFGTLDVLADEALAAPTALLVDCDGSVVVADAGHDMLFRIAGGADGDVVIGPIAGSGFSGTRDGNAGQAELAQPTGLARTPTGLAFCDAASSNIRLLTDRGRVVTITGNDFYQWGLVDGPAHLARLQRPSGLCATADGAVVIADTGNDRVRLLEDRRIRTLGLSGLDQPGDVAVLGSGHLVIADTGNHRLVVADPALRTGWPLAVYPATMTSVWAPADDDATAPGSM